MKDWFRMALQPAVVLRAAKVAGVVGAVLILINHGDALWRGEIAANRFFKMMLTVCVPYLVSTYSSVEAMRSSR